MKLKSGILFILVFVIIILSSYKSLKCNMVKKVNFKNSRNLTLVASLWPVTSNAVIIMAHGSGSNRLANGLFEKVATSLQKENYNVLSFDFSGHGESDDDVFNLKKSYDDLASAIKYAKSLGFKRIALFGHSLSALTCLELYSPEIETMILIGALTGPAPLKWEELCTPEQLEEIKKTGYVTSQVNDGLRKIVKTDANLLQEIINFDQEKILSKIKCPVLIIHGDQDKFEKDFLEFSKKALNFLPKNSGLKVIKGASHSFLNHTNEVIDFTKNWLKEYFAI